MSPVFHQMFQCHSTRTTYSMFEDISQEHTKTWQNFGEGLQKLESPYNNEEELLTIVISQRSTMSEPKPSLSWLSPSVLPAFCAEIEESRGRRLLILLI